MKILIDDGFQLQVGTGIGQYTKMLIEDLKIANKDVEVTRYKIMSKLNKNLRRLVYILYINTIRKIKERRYDVVHYTNYVVPFIKSKKCVNVVTIHDLVAFKFPETLPTFYRVYNQLMIKNSLKNADLIITVSESIKSEILEIFPMYNDKVEVVYIGVNDAIKYPKEVIESNISAMIYELKKEKFFLFVGTIEKRKNVDFIVKAFIKAKKENLEMGKYKLVLAGKQGFGFNEIEELIKTSEFKNDIMVTGYISEDELTSLYNNCEAYVFASKYEGFGIPQIECMECKTPIILSNIPTNLEISKDYGEYFDLSNENSLIEKFIKFAKDEYDHDLKREVAKKRMISFDRKLIIDKMISLYSNEIKYK